jgi:hypothetical protein
MKRFSAFLLCACSPVLGQVQPNPIAVTKTLLCELSSSSTCGHGYINGRKYETMASDGVTVFVVGDVFGRYLRADVYVLNQSSATVDVFPGNFVLTEVAPKQKELKYVDGDKLLRSEQKRLAWGNALTAMSGNMARQQSTTNTTADGTINATSSNGTTATSTYHGTSTATTSVPDYAAQARAAETIRARNDAFNSFASVASRVILRANTVMPNQSAQGFILYERDRKAKSVMLSCIVGNTIYQFPFRID